jgi:hypothetical protein
LSHFTKLLAATFLSGATVILTAMLFVRAAQVVRKNDWSYVGRSLRRIYRPPKRKTMQHRFPEPQQCTYWRNPVLVRAAPMKERFELIDTYADESHLRRYLLKCRECGQLYFFEFYEWIDWEHGNDPQYSKYIPVPTVDDAQMLRKASQAELLLFSPSLNLDFPKDADAPKIYWAGKAS